MMPIPERPYFQMEDAAFYKVKGKYGTEYYPIDEQAVYGWLVLGDREETVDIAHRNAPRDLRTALLTLQKGDQVRVNDNSWMNVLGRDMGNAVAQYQNGSVRYELWDSYTPKRIDIESGPRMFRKKGHTSEGSIHCLEVKWDTSDRVS